MGLGAGGAGCVGGVGAGGSEHPGCPGSLLVAIPVVPGLRSRPWVQPKGADRKQKTDREKVEKQPAPEREKFQPAYESTVLAEVGPGPGTPQLRAGDPPGTLRPLTPPSILSAPRGWTRWVHPTAPRAPRGCRPLSPASC